MNSYPAIDLSQLPPPDIVESFKFEDLYESMKAALNGEQPMLFATGSHDPVEISAQQLTDDTGASWFRVDSEAEQLMYVQMESPPVARILGVCAYRECLLRQRVNAAVRAVMLAYAEGADLDQHGANYGQTRLVIDPGDPTATPPVEPVYETDTEFRRRILLVFESLSVAGSAGAYLYHALSADVGVLDAAVDSPTPGEVRVTIMGREGDGKADPVLISAVSAWLRDGEIRPLTDNVQVQSVSVQEYQVNAGLLIYKGQDSEQLLQDATQQLSAYTAEQHRIGRAVTLSGLYSALHTTGVQNVVLHEPVADIETTGTETAYCTAVNVVIESVVAKEVPQFKGGNP